MSTVDLKAKEAEAAAARAQFMTTLHDVQHRLSPKTIAADVKEKVREKADGAKHAARDGMAQAATHPSTVAAIAVPLLVFLFRRPLARGLHALFGRKDDAPQPQPVPPSPYQAARDPAPLPVEPIRAPERVPAEQGA